MALDTHTPRLDVAAMVREARRDPRGATQWNHVSVRLDEDGAVLVLDDGRLTITLRRVRVPLPSGRLVLGPIVADCPRRCGRRARVLWAHPYDRDVLLACRKCARVEYATAKTRSEFDRARIAYDRLRARLGLTRPWQTFERKPYQRRHTYARLAARLDDARRRMDGSWAP